MKLCETVSRRPITGLLAIRLSSMRASMGVEEGGGSKSHKPGVVLIGNRQTVETQNRIVTVGLRNILFKFRTSRKTYPNTPRLAPVLKTVFHQCVISYTCSQSYSDGSVLNRAIRVRLATCIQYDTLMKNCFKDWRQSTNPLKLEMDLS